MIKYINVVLFIVLAFFVVFTPTASEPLTLKSSSLVTP